MEANGKAKAETARSTAESVELEAFAPMSMVGIAGLPS